MAKRIKVLLLLALPASGKSEVRKYLRSLDPKTCLKDFHIGPAVQLDDFPYVHFMRRVDEELVAMDQPPAFFNAQDKPFQFPEDWLTLVELLIKDFSRLGTGWKSRSPSKAYELLERLNAAALQADAGSFLSNMNLETRAELKAKLETDAAKIIAALEAECAKDMKGATVIMEFARGGPVGASMPLEPPLGYEHSLAQLSPKILSQASILYVDVNATQAHQKNRDRMPPPGFTGDIGIYHFVPQVVMDHDYGCDDIGWLMKQSKRPNTIRIQAHGKVFHIPCVLFNNRTTDLTTFARRPKEEWAPIEAAALHRKLKKAFDVLAAVQA